MLIRKQLPLINLVLYFDILHYLANTKYFSFLPVTTIFLTLKNFNNSFFNFTKSLYLRKNNQQFFSFNIQKNFKTYAPRLYQHQLLKLNNNLYFKITTSLFWIFNVSQRNDLFNIHYEYKNMYLEGTSSYYFIRSEIFFTKWTNGLHFLINTFYIEPLALLLGTSFFKSETLAFNWSHLSVEFSFWNYYSRFFTLKTNKISDNSRLFFRQLKSKKIDVFFIYDCYYHFKNLYYINKFLFFSIALVNKRINPWLVGYGLPALNDSFLTHLMFFKILNYSKKTALNLKYFFLKNNWIFLSVFFKQNMLKL